MDARASRLLDAIRDRLIAILGENLVGLYVHGSLAFDCFCWERSDIDFLIVTNTIPSLDQRMAIIQDVNSIPLEYPLKGIEYSLVLLKDCLSITYPIPFYLHYSEGYHLAAKHDLRAYCERMQGTDVDLSAHFMITKKAGICWYGRPIDAVFGNIPSENYWKSICADVDSAEQKILVNPVYYILNLCRVLAYKQEKIILSKQQGGIWGCKHLPKDASLIQQALRCYAGEAEIVNVSEAELQAFARKLLHFIQSA